MHPALCDLFSSNLLLSWEWAAEHMPHHLWLPLYTESHLNGWLWILHSVSWEWAEIKTIWEEHFLHFLTNQSIMLLSKLIFLSLNKISVLKEKRDSETFSTIYLNIISYFIKECWLITIVGSSQDEDAAELKRKQSMTNIWWQWKGRSPCSQEETSSKPLFLHILAHMGFSYFSPRLVGKHHRLYMRDE